MVSNLSIFCAIKHFLHKKYKENIKNIDFVIERVDFICGKLQITLIK